MSNVKLEDGRAKRHPCRRSLVGDSSMGTVCKYAQRILVVVIDQAF